MMEFRRLVSKDLESYYDLRLKGLKEAPSAFLTTYAEQLERGSDFYAKILGDSNNDNVIFGAVKDGQVLGVAGIFRQIEKAKTAHKAWLWGMYVDPSARGQNVGGRLVDLVLTHTRENMPVSAVYLSVESENTAALKLYQSRGFKIWGTEPRAMFDGGHYHDDHHMVVLLE
jgi:RimJ/RimL family protein N-acetyltransferase